MPGEFFRDILLLMKGLFQMENNTLLVKIKNEGKSFFTEVANANHLVYYILLTLYVALYLILNIAWNGKYERIERVMQYGCLGIVMWGSTVYLFFVIAGWKNLWKKTIPLILIGGAMLAATGFFSRKMSTNLYGVVMDAFFCLMAFGKDFRKILKCILAVCITALLAAGIGLKVGYSFDMGKPDTTIPGHSLGINYPNTWGYLVFLAMIIIWYLYLRNKKILTFLLFWPVCVFMYKFITCRTIAGITLIFPVLGLIVDCLESRADKKSEEGVLKRNKILDCILISIPFIAFAVMMYSSMRVDWWHQYYYGRLRNLAWRFIQGGLYFKTYGLPLIGNPYRSNVFTYVNVQGDFIKVGILDSSFAAYIIMRGILWLFYTLSWLCVAHWKALKKRDYAIILIETIFLGFAMMERPGLEMWYNFILLYPLAKVMSKPGTEPVLEFADKSNESGVSDQVSSYTETDTTQPETEICAPESDHLLHSDLPEDVI